jgi:hypothetical protein
MPAADSTCSGTAKNFRAVNLVFVSSYQEQSIFERFCKHKTFKTKCDFDPVKSSSNPFQYQSLLVYETFSSILKRHKVFTMYKI